MKIIENVTLYKCDHCGKEYKRRHNCIRHEERCSSNPINYRDCFCCDEIEKKNVDINFQYDYGEYSEEREILYCSKVRSFLYPPSVEHKKNYYLQEDIDNGEIGNIPMPKKCKYCPDFDDMFQINNITNK